MAANGLIYTASFSNVSITNAAQNIWEFIAGAGCSVLIHSIRKHGAPSQFICDSSPEFHSAIFEQWASRQQLFLSFVTRGTLGNM